MNVSTLQRIKLGPIILLVFMAVVSAALALVTLEDTTYILIAVAVTAGGFVVAQTLKNWRTGLAIFLVWMLFEDLARKYLGNNMAVYFAKDVLLAACCISYYAARLREKHSPVRASFFFPLFLFFVWSLLEVFNFASPSIW